MKTTEVFNKVASNYDLMNDIMSVGAHRYWKECLIDWLKPSLGMNIVDVAGGTGDIARRFLDRINGEGFVTVCDPNINMTKFGKQKNCKKHRTKSMEIGKNIDFGGARNKRTSPSNSTRKTTYIDLFSCLYDRKWSKTLPVHVRKRSYVSVHNCMNACVFYALVLHIGVGGRRLDFQVSQGRLASENGIK